MPRELYLIDEEADDGRGKVVRRWPVEGMTEGQIMALERKILAEAGDDVVLRDSRFD